MRTARVGSISRMGKLDAYFRKYRHYPRIRRNNGRVQTITVHIAPGYAMIRTSPHNATIYIPHSTWREILRFGVKMEKYMEDDFDVEAAMKEAIRFEDELAKEMRQFKKTLYQPRRKRRR